MQIQTFNQRNFSPVTTNRPAAQAATEFAPADTAALDSIGSSVESQDRFDSIAKGIGGMMFGGIGAAGGGVGGAVISAFSGASGWGVALATVGGIVGGGLVGAYLGSR